MFRRLIDVPEKPSAAARKGWHSLCPIGEMQWLLRRETSRADRTGRPFCLVLFRLSGTRRRSFSNFRLARQLIKRARLTDEVGWFSEQYLAALLPDTSPAGARIFSDRVCSAVKPQGARPLALLYSYPDPEVKILPAGIEPAHVAGPVNGGNNGHSNGNGHHNGHGLAKPANGTNGHGRLTAVLAPIPLTAADLVPSLQAGLNGKPLHLGLSPGSVQELLVHPMPRWKRAIDVLGALIGLVVFLPAMAFAAIGILLTSRGPVIFKQKRSGLGGKPFVIYKFRTMVPDAEAHKQELRPLSEQDGPAFKMEKDPRLTRFGSFLRKTSLDELPQLWNVVKGDMSLVGPRPLPCDETDASLAWHRRRLDITPGLTCIWQVKGRSRVTFDEWVRMDVAYMRRRTLLHDLWLLLITIPAVLLRRGAR